MKDDNERDIRLTDFDYLTADPHLQMMKAALPYMQPAQQRMFSLMIRLQEFNHTRSMFQQGELSAMGLSPSTPQKTSPVEMLQALKPYASPREQDMIDMMENLQIMIQAMQTSGS